MFFHPSPEERRVFLSINALMRTADQRNGTNDEQMIVKFSTVAGDSSLSGTLCFEESVPLGQQNLAVNHGLQPKAVMAVMELGYSLSEHTDFFTQNSREATTHSLK